MDHDEERRAELTCTFRVAQEALSDVLVAQSLASLSQTHLTAQQLRVLAILLLGGASTPTDLAGTLGVSGATVSGLVDRLVATGMAERRPHPSDGRVRLVSATEAAATTLRELVASQPPPEHGLLDQLSLTELEHLALGTAALLRVVRGTAEPSDQGTRA